MKKLLIISILLAAGCGGGELTDEAQVAKAVCDPYCEMCGEVDSCAHDCLVQWSIFGETSEKSECGTLYLVGLGCRLEHSCDDPGCGDPLEDMYRCAANID